MKKKLTALFIAAAFIACLAGCKYVHGIEISMFGNAKVFEAQTMTEEVIANSYGDVDTFYSNVEDSYQGTGYTVERFTENEASGQVAYGYKALSPSMASASIAPELQKLMGEDFVITYDNTGFFTKNVTVSLTCNGDPLEGYEQYELGDEFTIKTPGPVLSSNGVNSADSANTVVWDIAALEFGAETQMTLTVSYLNPLIFLIAGCLLVIVIVLVIILVMNNAKKKKAAAMEEAINSFEAEAQAEVNSAVEEVKEEAAEAVEEVKAETSEAVEEVKEEASEAVEEVKEEATEAVEEVKEETAEVVEEVKSEE